MPVETAFRLKYKFIITMAIIFPNPFLLKSSWELPSTYSNVRDINMITNLLMNLKFPHANFNADLPYITDITFYVVKNSLTLWETVPPTLSLFLIIM